MKILEIDAGNTRLKWRLLEQTQQKKETIKSGAALAVEKKAMLPEEFQQQIHALHVADPGAIEVVRASNVRGATFAKALSGFCEELLSVAVDFALVRQNHAGLQNSYQLPTALGVDRWLAMLAAYKSSQQAVCVIDCGSAMTVDLVSANGLHEGGFIVPGLQLMKLSLGEHTAELGYRPEDDFALEPGKSTAEAINHGILTMVLGMLEHVHDKWGADKNWYLCGGDAALLASFIDWPHQLMPELVMDGLAIACGKPGASTDYS
tara:strand:- start:81666 stop:82454 length:789 start_codon:yes stop_codon:yes gene_type:complete